MKKIVILMTIFGLLCILMCACGANGELTSDADSGISADDILSEAINESYFLWDGNYIVGLSDDGFGQKSVVIPARCEGFSGVVFQGSDISKVFFEDDDDISLDFAFMGAENLTHVELPDNLTTIPYMSFQMCESLTSITIPESVQILDDYAFSSCNNLKNVQFDGVSIVRIGDNCFEGCDFLSEITIPDGVEHIGKYAFFNCESLCDVSFSSTVSKIDKFAFGNTAISEIRFPDDIVFSSLDDSAFGTNAYTSTVYIGEGSWCDLNRSSWDIGFGDIKYK